MEKLILIYAFFIQFFIGAVVLGAGAMPYEPFEKSVSLSTSKTISESKKAQLQLIYFWASWCPDCKDKFSSGLEKYQSNSVDLLTLSIEDNKEKVSKFITKNAIKYPVYYDPERRLQKELKIFSVPTVVLVKLVDGKVQIIEQVSGKDWSKIDSAISIESKKM